MSAIELHLSSTGDGPDVFVCHGLFGSATNWRTPAKALSARYRVHAVDARNHGRSPHTEAMDYPSMAADLAHTMASLGIDRAHLVGHSMGGKTVMALALAQPERVASLAIVDVAPVAYPHGFEDELKAMRALALDTLTRRADADAALADALPDKGLRAFLLQNLVQDEGRYRWRVNLDAIERSIGDLTAFPAPPGAHYHGPTLFIRGGNSHYVLDTHRQTIETLFPAATVSTVEGAGHWLHAERPAQVLTLLEAHLASAASA